MKAYLPCLAFVFPCYVSSQQNFRNASLFLSGDSTAGRHFFQRSRGKVTLSTSSSWWQCIAPCTATEKKVTQEDHKVGKVDMALSNIVLTQR